MKWVMVGGSLWVLVSAAAGWGFFSFLVLSFFPGSLEDLFSGRVYSMKWRTMVGWFLFRGVLGCFEGFGGTIG